MDDVIFADNGLYHMEACRYRFERHHCIVVRRITTLMRRRPICLIHVGGAIAARRLDESIVQGVSGAEPAMNHYLVFGATS